VTEDRSRPAWARVDLDAVRHNVAALTRLAAPSALCAVVKADAYGHGSTEVAQAAVEGGATWLAVALVEEGARLRRAGIEAPILLLSEPEADGLEAAVAYRLTPTLYTAAAVGRAAAAAAAAGVVAPVHVKVDTGMHRVGATPADAFEIAMAAAGEASLDLEGIWTHLAVADGGSAEDRAFTAAQLQRFDDVVDKLAAEGVRPRVRHAANSAATVVHADARYQMVRCGLAVYGYLPTPEVAAAFAEASGGAELRPVLSLLAKVSAVRLLERGDRPSYGRRRPLPQRSVVATVPIGYADGVPRALFDGGFEVLIGGRRHPLAGTVTMDQIVVDCGADAPVAPGDEVVLLGRQGDEVVTADEWARRLGTISYEVLTGIGPRVPRLTDGEFEPRWRAWAPGDPGGDR